LYHGGVCDPEKNFVDQIVKLLSILPVKIDFF